MNLAELLAKLQVAPPLTRGRIAFAVSVAAIADAIQLLLGPFGWTFLDEGIDVLTMLLTVWTLGFHILLLPTFVVELVPVVDMLPTWTACVLAVIALRKTERRVEPAPAIDVPVEVVSEESPKADSAASGDKSKSTP